jgi:hypothetical protein
MLAEVDKRRKIESRLLPGIARFFRPDGNKRFQAPWFDGLVLVIGALFVL